MMMITGRGGGGGGREMALIINPLICVCLWVCYWQARISLAAVSRGDIQIHLSSPSGTRSTLLALRPHDSSRNGFHSWPFMSVHYWGESPFGVWTLEIHNEGRYLGEHPPFPPPLPSTPSFNPLPGGGGLNGSSEESAREGFQRFFFRNSGGMEEQL